MKDSAIIGYTGFVGSFLGHACRFDRHINRENLESLRGARLGRVVCAGLPAAKWLANLDPQADAANLHRLEATLSTVSADPFVLISTIDVYPDTHGLDETYDSTRREPEHAYGRHRLQFEHFVRQRFPGARIVRLPAIFGTGLRKNVIFDLLNDNRLERVNPDSRFQWYPLARLPQDLETVEASRLSLVNLFTEPVATRAILSSFFPEKKAGYEPDPPVSYDLRTRHGVTFGGDSRYVMRAEAVMSALDTFVGAQQVHA